MILYLRIIFTIFFIIELLRLKFRRKAEKRIWILVAVIFGYFGYFVFVAYKRHLTVKRKFNPIFKSKS